METNHPTTQPESAGLVHQQVQPGYGNPFHVGRGHAGPYIALQMHEDERCGIEPTSDYDGIEPIWLGDRVDDEWIEELQRLLNLGFRSDSAALTLSTRLDRALGLLREPEWCVQNAFDHPVICPICYGNKTHEATCRLDALLSECQPQEQGQAKETGDG